MIRTVFAWVFFVGLGLMVVLDFYVTYGKSWRGWLLGLVTTAVGMSLWLALFYLYLIGFFDLVGVAFWAVVLLLTTALALRRFAVRLWAIFADSRRRHTPPGPATH